ncbi:hypothetical protein [Corynebacterium silvaticum]|uniref:hypothetical protein n=1 Tax=Corynebacterium silvaticum TaxID=2320431 RepID=UPI0018D97BEA|nr:hypothetical protein [Corynebacterium silvaticum]
MADVQMSMFIQSLQSIAEYIATIANKYLVVDMVEKYTGEGVGSFPRIAFDTIGSKTGYSPQDLVALKNAGLVTGDGTLEEYVRRRGELPPLTPFKEALEKKAERRQLEQELGVTLSSTPVEPANTTPDAQTMGGVMQQQQHSSDDLQKLTSAAGTLIRSGFDPAAALEAVGLDPIKHTGLLPVTVKEGEA